MGDQREKCSGRPERKGGQPFPYRPRGAPRAEPLANVPGPDHPRFADIRPFFRQRKDDPERRRREQLEHSRRRAEAIEDARIRRRFEREEAEHQRELEAFWRTFHRKVRTEDGVARHPPEHGLGDRNGGTGSHSVRPPYALAAYSAPIIDRQGRRGVFMSSTYLSAKTSAYGSMRRLSYYVTQPESLEEIEDNRAFFSNMGETRQEIATGMGLVEDANRAARANAKLAVTFIIQLPHDVTPKERLRILRVWCEEKLGIHDLPYVAALHKPSRDGDQRNYHGHVVTSFRPAFRTSPYEWRIAQGLRTDLDNPAMFEEFRRDLATIMTAVVQIAGKDRVYTHLSHAARGLKHKPTEKLGPQKTRDIRAGEHVPANARNAQVIARNEALAEIDRIDGRSAKRRRRVRRLRRLKVAAARPLSPAIAVLVPERPARPSVLAQVGRHVLPHLSPALLAAAARATDTPRLRDSVPDQEHNLAKAPALQDVVLLTDFTHAPSAVIAPNHGAHASHRVSNVTDVAVEIPISASIRRPTRPDRTEAERAQANSLAGWPAIDTPVAASIHELAARIDAVPVRRASHRLSSLSTVSQIGEGLRRLTSVAPVVRSGSSPKRLSIVQESGRDDPVAGSQPSAQIATPTLRMPVARQLSSVAGVEDYDRVPCRRLSDRRPVDRLSADPARRLKMMESTSSAAHRKVPTLDLLSAKLARLKARVAEVEQQDEARAQAEAAHTAARQQAADYERYLRFLALVALNPDWLEHGKLGLDLAAHVPARARELYASWRNDHERLATIGEVRQAALDGVHRIDPALAGQVERTAADLVARLPAPPPLRDSVGRPSPAAEIAMALVAANPHWLTGSSSTAQASLDAPPALVGVVERYEKDPALGSLLAAAKRHSEGITTALQPTLAMMVDRRREEIALRRASGRLRVLAPDGDRLSPTMADHLAKVRRHPEWIVRGTHLGLGLAEGVPPTFREQWIGWNEPALARQLLLDIVAPTSATRALTPAMRTQVFARMQAFPRQDVMGRDRVLPDEGRSR